MSPPPENEKGAAGDFYRAAWIFYLALAIGGVVWLGFARGDIELAAFLSTATWPRDLLAGTATALVLIGLWRGGRRFVPPMALLEERIAAAIGRVEKAEVLVLALLSGFAEELFFRGALLQALGPWVSTGLFAVAHGGRGAVFRYWILFALVAGGLFAALTLLTGNLLAAIWAHMLVNAVNLSRLASRGPEERAPEEPP